MALGIKDLLKPIYLKYFLFNHLPLALFAGLKLEAVNGDLCVTSLPYNWRTKNPFHSIYFAAQAMAAEFSTGALIVNAIDKTGRDFGMLVTDMKAEFVKKATSRVTFTCQDGMMLTDGVIEAIRTGEPIILKAKSEGRDVKGDLISTFHFTWSILDKKRLKM